MVTQVVTTVTLLKITKSIFKGVEDHEFFFSMCFIYLFLVETV